MIHPLKDMGEISGGNPFPVISHYDFCLLLRFGHGQGHLSCAAVRQDILQQVIENTGVGGRVNPRHVFCFGYLNFIGEIVAFQQRHPVSHDVAGKLVQVADFKMKNLLPGIQLHPFKQGGHKVFQVVGFFHSHPDIFFLLGPCHHLAFHGFQIAHQRGKRRFHIMGKACHKPFISLLGLLLLYQSGLAAHSNLVDVIADLFRQIAFPRQYTAVQVPVLYICQSVFDKGKLAPDAVKFCQKVADYQQGNQ